MKKYFRVLISSIFLLFVAGTAFADSLTFVSLGGGAGGKSKSTNFSLDIGGVNLENGLLYAFTVGVIRNGGDVPAGVLDYPVPHTFYNDLGVRQDGSEFAILGKLGIEVADSGLFLIGILGGSISNEIHLAQSTVTGWFYTQSKASKYNGVYGAGAAYLFNKSVILEIDYDNRRGVTGMLGVKF